jgi:hypothetical protein
MALAGITGLAAFTPTITRLLRFARFVRFTRLVRFARLIVVVFGRFDPTGPIDLALYDAVIAITAVELRVVKAYVGRRRDSEQEQAEDRGQKQ